MSDLREAAEQVVESLDDGYDLLNGSPGHKALRAVLDAQEDEPVASQSQTHLLRWAHTKDDAPQTEYQRGYDAARRWVQEVGLHSLDAQEPTRKAATAEEVMAAYAPSWSGLTTPALHFAGWRAAERFHGIKEDET